MEANWEDRLIEAINRHRALPFAYGTSDCFDLMMDAAKAVSGTDPYASERGRYKTKVGAAGRLKRRGFASVEEAVAAAFREIPMAQAKRGDLALLGEGDWTGGVVMGAEIIGKTEAGIRRVPLKPAWRYFSVRG